MAHPDYVYTPRTPEVRAKMSLAHRRRLGIPDGCARLCGLHVPIAFADEVRQDAYWLLYNRGEEDAHNFIAAVGKIDWSLAGEFLGEFMTYREVGDFFGIPHWYVEKRTRHLRRINPRRYDRSDDV